MIVAAKYANELISLIFMNMQVRLFVNMQVMIHEYAGNATQKYTAPDAIAFYHHAKIEDDRMLG